MEVNILAFIATSLCVYSSSYYFFTYNLCIRIQMNKEKEYQPLSFHFIYIFAKIEKYMDLVLTEFGKIFSQCCSSMSSYTTVVECTCEDILTLKLALRGKSGYLKVCLIRVCLPKP